MTELLSHAEYKAIAAELIRPVRRLSTGSFRRGVARKWRRSTPQRVT